jgi:hypothetical protein
VGGGVKEEKNNSTWKKRHTHVHTRIIHSWMKISCQCFDWHRKKSHHYLESLLDHSYISFVCGRSCEPAGGCGTCKVPVFTTETLPHHHLGSLLDHSCFSVCVWQVVWTSWWMRDRQGCCIYRRNLISPQAPSGIKSFSPSLRLKLYQVNFFSISNLNVCSCQTLMLLCQERSL